MNNKLDPGDRLFVGIILAIVGLVGLVLVYRSFDYSIIIGEAQGFHSFQGGGLSVLSIIIIVLFILVTLLGIYIIYDTIRKDKRNNQ
jgi:uncharacterized membrane protein